MSKISKSEIELFRSNMSTFRRMAGWTAAELAEKVDLSRQTIVNLETRENSMSCLQYIAFRSLFEREALLQEKAGNKVLLESLSYFLTKDSSSSDQIRTIAAAKAGGANNNQLAMLINALLPAAAVVAAEFITLGFLDKIIDDQ